MFLEAQSPTLMLPFNSLGGESFTIQTPKNDKKKKKKKDTIGYPKIVNLPGRKKKMYKRHVTMNNTNCCKICNVFFIS